MTDPNKDYSIDNLGSYYQLLELDQPGQSQQLQQPQNQNQNQNQNQKPKSLPRSQVSIPGTHNSNTTITYELPRSLDLLPQQQYTPLSKETMLYSQSQSAYSQQQQQQQPQLQQSQIYERQNSLQTILMSPVTPNGMIYPIRESPQLVPVPNPQMFSPQQQQQPQPPPPIPTMTPEAPQHQIDQKNSKFVLIQQPLLNHQYTQNGLDSQNLLLSNSLPQSLLPYQSNPDPASFEQFRQWQYQQHLLNNDIVPVSFYNSQFQQQQQQNIIIPNENSSSQTLQLNYGNLVPEIPIYRYLQQQSLPQNMEMIPTPQTIPFVQQQQQQIMFLTLYHEQQPEMLQLQPQILQQKSSDYQTLVASQQESHNSDTVEIIPQTLEQQEKFPLPQLASQSVGPNNYSNISHQQQQKPVYYYPNKQQLEDVIIESPLADSLGEGTTSINVDDLFTYDPIHTPFESTVNQPIMNEEDMISIVNQELSQLATPFSPLTEYEQPQPIISQQLMTPKTNPKRKSIKKTKSMQQIPTSSKVIKKVGNLHKSKSTVSLASPTPNDTHTSPVLLTNAKTTTMKFATKSPKSTLSKSKPTLNNNNNKTIYSFVMETGAKILKRVSKSADSTPNSVSRVKKSNSTTTVTTSKKTESSAASTTIWSSITPLNSSHKPDNKEKCFMMTPPS